MGQLVHIDNAVFRAIKAATRAATRSSCPPPARCRAGCCTRRRRRSVRIPDHKVAQALLTELGEPILSSTLLLPGDEEPLTQGWEVGAARPPGRRGDRLGWCNDVPTTVVDFSSAGDRAPWVRRPDPVR